MSSEQQVSWNQIDQLVQSLSKKILKLPRDFSSITTLSRGGLIPSRLLADHLDIKKIFVDKKRINSDSLFVDDIFDSGSTFDNVLSITDNPSRLVFATLFARRGKSYPAQLIYGKKTKSSSYVIFPWDILEFQRSIT